MFCPKCGKAIHNGSYKCDSCGATVGDKGGFKYGLLGFFFPIPAIIIYYMLRDKEPNLCESFKIGAITGLIMSVLYIGAVFLILMTDFMSILLI